jgi:hypothetical protein
MTFDGAVIRRARQSDAEGIARVHVASSVDSLAPLAREWPVPNLARAEVGFGASPARMWEESAANCAAFRR